VLTHGSLFAGIGGFDLGFERAGIKTIWQVEIDDYCRRVLARHFPSAKRYTDIRECGSHNLEPVDILSGGFPCQDISHAGKRTGIEGERSGLWSEYARIIRELRPHYVVVENVAALLGRGMERVLGDLAEIGYDAEWQSIRASDVGAPHIRERIWIVAYPSSERRQQISRNAYANESEDERWPTLQAYIFAGHGKDVSDTGSEQHESDCFTDEWSATKELFMADSTSARRDGSPRQEQSICGRSLLSTRSSGCGEWAVEPNVGRVATRVPSRVDRLKGLGNAVVPAIAEFIGRLILDEV
jgi:DNA (cytosine-5)-methyltransferase 1